MHEGAPALPDKDERAQPETPENRPPETRPPESEVDARARRAASGYDLRPGRPAYPAAAPRQPQAPAAPKQPDKWCANCRIWNRPDAESCVSCNGELEETAQRQRTNAANHTLVWICAFVPLAGLVVDLVLISRGISAWWTLLPVIIANWVLLGIDSSALGRLGYNADRLNGLVFIIVPVYLFKRVSIAGGGYGYGAVWIATFLAALLIPLLFGTGFSTSVSTSSLTCNDDVYLQSSPAYFTSTQMVIQLEFTDDDQNSCEIEGTATVSIYYPETNERREVTRQVTKSRYGEYRNLLTDGTGKTAQVNVPYGVDEDVWLFGNPPVVRLRFDSGDRYWDWQELELYPKP